MTMSCVYCSIGGWSQTKEEIWSHLLWLRWKSKDNHNFGKHNISGWRWWWLVPRIFPISSFLLRKGGSSFVQATPPSHQPALSWSPQAHLWGRGGQHQIEKYFWFSTFSLQTLLLSVPQPAPIGGLPYHWLNGGSSSDHLLPRHAGSKPQRGLGETDKDLQ